MNKMIFEAVRKELEGLGFRVELHHVADIESSTYLLFSKDGMQIGQPMTASELQAFFVQYSNTSGEKSLFIFHFLSGSSPQMVHERGEVHKAFGRLGFGGGAVAALDYYEEIKL